MHQIQKSLVFIVTTNKKIVFGKSKKIIQQEELVKSIIKNRLSKKRTACFF